MISVFEPIFTRCSPPPGRNSSNSLVRPMDSLAQAVGTSASSGSIDCSFVFIRFVFHAVTAGRASPLTDEAAPLLQIGFGMWVRRAWLGLMTRARPAPFSA